MYLPKTFEITDRSEIFSFVRANAFGQLISTVQGRLFSTHLPFLVSADNTRLLGHIARQNPQALEISTQEVLVIFQGAHGYVSPSWYASPGVPTWNYQAAHIYASCKTFDDPEQLEELVDTLTQSYEALSPRPWQPQYDPRLLEAIVGIELTVADVQCKFKLSQNRPDQDQLQVIKQLKKTGSEALAQAMERQRRLK